MRYVWPPYPPTKYVCVLYEICVATIPTHKVCVCTVLFYMRYVWPPYPPTKYVCVLYCSKCDMCGHHTHPQSMCVYCSKCDMCGHHTHPQSMCVYCSKCDMCGHHTHPQSMCVYCMRYVWPPYPPTQYVCVLYYKPRLFCPVSKGWPKGLALFQLNSTLPRIIPQEDRS